jgi:hypothetical protein
VINIGGTATVLGKDTDRDATVARLASLRRLETLALAGTAVTEASITTLSRLPALKTLRLAGTPAQHAAQSANLPVAPTAADMIPPIEPVAKGP